jgi:hypothetical protein
LVRIACGTLVLGVVVAASGHVAAFGHENRLTFNKAVMLPGVVLPAGAYSFDVADAGASLDIVIVRNAARTKVYYLGFTNPIERPSNLSRNTAVVFGEARANEPPPITRWYEAGSSTGHEFLYR